MKCTAEADPQLVVHNWFCCFLLQLSSCKKGFNTDSYQGEELQKIYWAKRMRMLKNIIDFHIYIKVYDLWPLSETISSFCLLLFPHVSNIVLPAPLSNIAVSCLKHHLLQKNSHIQWSWLPFPGSVQAIYHYWYFASFNLLSCPCFSVCSGVQDNITLSLKTCHACWDLEFLLKAFVSILPKLGETFLRKKWQEDQTATVWYLLWFCPNHLFCCYNNESESFLLRKWQED